MPVTVIPPMITALGHMMRQAGNDNARDASHGITLTSRATAPQTGGKTVTVSNCVLARQAMQAMAQQSGDSLVD
ncbi:MAG: hypothetical protein ACKVP5_23530 [Aestuariivirga sp.]